MIAVIGDVHGCYNTLVKLVDEIEKKYPSLKIYCVGDLVDRGNFSFEVVEFIISKKIIFTPGNHDYMFYYYFTSPNSHLGRSWIYNGYEPTLRSYENRTEKIDEHLKLIISAPLFIDHQDCFISHAGISSLFQKELTETPLKNIDKFTELVKREITNDHGIIWCRDELMNLGKLQIVGHTRQFEIKFDEKSNSVYIDTAAVASNKLSAVVVDNNKIKEKISVFTDPMDVASTGN